MISLQKRALAALMILSVLVAAPQAHGDAAPSAIPSRALRSGDHGELVVELQQRLSELGYLHDRVDGRYGARTQLAVNRFQKSEGLKVSGIADDSTLSLLYDPDTKPAIVFIAPSGKRYHARQNCRGLKLAKSISEMSFPEAQAKRTPCIICYGRLALRIAEERRAALNADSEELEAA